MLKISTYFFLAFLVFTNSLSADQSGGSSVISLQEDFTGGRSITSSSYEPRFTLAYIAFPIYDQATDDIQTEILTLTLTIPLIYLIWPKLPDQHELLIDNGIHGAVSAIEKKTRKATIHYSGSSDFAVTLHSSAYMASGLFLTNQYPDSSEVSHITGKWEYRVGTKGIGDIISVQPGENGDLDRGTKYFNCLRIVILAAMYNTHYPIDSPTIKLMSKMWFSYGTTSLQSTIINDLVDQGFTAEEANWHCAEISFLAGSTILTLSKFYTDPLSTLLIVGSMKMCADCVLSNFKLVVLPVAKGLKRVIMEFTLEAVLYAGIVNQVIKFHHPLSKIFLGKMRDYTIIHPANRLTQYSLAVLIALISTVSNLTPLLSPNGQLLL